MSRDLTSPNSFWTGYHYTSKDKIQAVDRWDFIVEPTDENLVVPMRMEVDVDHQRETAESDLILFDPFSMFMVADESLRDIIKEINKPKDDEEEEDDGRGRPFGTLNVERQRDPIRTPAKDSKPRVASKSTDHVKDFDRKREGAGKEPRK